MNGIQRSMDKSDFDGSINTDIGQHEITGSQNIFNDLISPNNMLLNGLMTCWLPMFTTSYFNASPNNISRNALSSLQHRSVIDDHPIGPLTSLFSNSSLPSGNRQLWNQSSQQTSNNFFSLLKNAPDKTMTLNDLIKFYDQPSVNVSRFYFLTLFLFFSFLVCHKNDNDNS